MGTVLAFDEMHTGEELADVLLRNALDAGEHAEVNDAVRQVLVVVTEELLLLIGLALLIIEIEGHDLLPWVMVVMPVNVQLN